MPINRKMAGVCLQHPGFWMALFSFAGLLMLFVAGERAEQRLTSRLQRMSNAVRPSAIAKPGNLPETPAEKIQYSLGALKWMLAIGGVAGTAWMLAGVLKSGKPNKTWEAGP